MTGSPPYHQTFRRTLRDMHIPDWDTAFLADYDPQATARRYLQDGVRGVLMYAKSHLGLCNYPTKTGAQHVGLAGRDVLGELNDELRAAGVATAVYTSVNFDNWAAEQHPDWRQIDLATGTDVHDRLRYGLVCPNNPDYRAYELGLLEEMLTGYSFDAIFLDMVFFTTLCGCPRCRDRYRAEVGAEIPTVVDWTDPIWCAFQVARERWISEWTQVLTDRCRALSPGIAVTHNLAPALMGWHSGQPLSAAGFDTFTSGDLYGDAVEQLLVSKLHLHLSRNRPAEFMTSICANLTDHVGLKSTDQLVAAALGAVATGNAFLLIDAIDPQGSTPGGAHDRLEQTFERIAAYESFLGGEPVEDVAVYLSGASLVDHAVNGRAVEVTRSPVPTGTIPHLESAKRACHALQRAHIPFGVISDAQLSELHRWPVVVLPNLARINDAEVAAFRDYVTRGGRLYASRYTSLVHTEHGRSDDFLLADLFGVAFVAEEEGAQVFLRPRESTLAAAIAPQHLLGHRVFPGRGPGRPLCGTPRVRSTGARVLATLTVPYGYPAPGTAASRDWAAIHSSPPWADLVDPVLLTNDVGQGRTVYSAFDLESCASIAGEALFIAVVRDLRDRPAMVEVDAPHAVWVNTFDQAAESRLLISLLHYPSDLPAATVTARVRVRPPAGRVLLGLRILPGGDLVRGAALEGGELVAQVEVSGGLVLLAGEYSSAPPTSTVAGPR